jgi:hypothetical protein
MAQNATGSAPGALERRLEQAMARLEAKLKP